VCPQRPTQSLRSRGGVRWWLGPATDPASADALLASALAAVEAGAVDLKDGRRKQLYRLALRGPATDHLLKVTRYRNGSPWTRRVRRSKARRELEMAVALNARGVDTPTPVAAGERRRFGLLSECYLLVPFESGAVDLAVCIATNGDAGVRRATTRSFGLLTRKLHALGFRQPDLAPNNFLWRRLEPQPVVPIDFERARLAPVHAELDRTERLRALAKLERHCQDASSTDRLRFLTTYSGSATAARSDWREIERYVAELFATDHARLRRRPSPDDRRTVALRCGRWRGWAARKPDGLASALAWLERDPAPESSQIAEPPSLWACFYVAEPDRSIRDLWATAVALWVRGLAPRPICVVQRGREIRLLLDRDVLDRDVLDRDVLDRSVLDADATAAADVSAGVEPEAVGPVVALIDRLLGLGTLSPEIRSESFASWRPPGRSPRAVLIDVALLRPGPPQPSHRRARAREIALGLLPAH